MLQHWHGNQASSERPGAAAPPCGLAGCCHHSCSHVCLAQEMFAGALGFYPSRCASRPSLPSLRHLSGSHTHPNVPPQSSQEGTLDAITPAENLPSLPQLLPPSGPFLKPDSCPSNASGDSSGHFSAARTAFPASSRPFPAGAAARVLLFSHILKRKSGILLSWGAQGRRAAPAGSQEATCGFHLAVFLKLF